MAPGLRTLWLVSILAVIPAACAEEIADAAQSPQTLAEFIDGHAGFDWAPIRAALKITDDKIQFPACDASFRGLPRCSTELITVLNPQQTLLIVEEEFGNQVVFRYLPAGMGTWKFAGAYSPSVKYFTPEHHIVRFGQKPYLALTEQGETGSGISTTITSWFDLTSDDFRPVFSYTSSGHHSPLETIGMEVDGLVSGLETGPTERIEITYSVRFSAIWDDEDIDLGNRDDKAVYLKRGDHFALSEGLSTATEPEIGTFYSYLPADPDPEEFLRFNLKGLQDVASGPNEAARMWLADYLEHAPETPESMELKALLRSRH